MSFQTLVLVSVHATDASVRDESDALKGLLALIETRFREEHVALVGAIKEHKSMTNAPTALLEARCAAR